MDNVIDKNLWHTCKICNEKISVLAKEYGGCGIYYTEVFMKHIINDHGITLEEYFSSYTNRPNCSCGICDSPVGVGGIKTPKFYWKVYKCGRNPGMLEWSEKAKTSRLGKNNPMYGVKAWNKGLNKYNNEVMNKISKDRIGVKPSEETKLKQSVSAKKRKIHGHTGKKHSQKTKNKLREMTIARMSSGQIKHTKTKPHIEMCNILNELHIKYIEEYNVHYWLFDLYLPEYEIYLEVDGDYYHSNPRRYKDGPKTKVQIKNHKRDIIKNEYCLNNNMCLIRFWEYDILNKKSKVIEELCNLIKSKK
jgi:very-short-patch-repair endonuclease